VRVAIIDYGSGNLHSAQKALERAAREAGVSADIALTGDAEDVRRADRVVLPGVGAFADCRAGLDAVPGMVEALEDFRRSGNPFLGICVGHQLLAERGLEKAETPGLGWIGGEVRRITPDDPALKVPQVGWNTLAVTHVKHSHPLLDGVPTGPDGLHAYFVHSFHFVAGDPADVLAVTDYGGPVTAAVARENVAGVQFHPEKSQRLGLGLIANFLRWRP
jgi:glutamine amidotransferase